jgi:hypothetical protein
MIALAEHPHIERRLAPAERELFVGALRAYVEVKGRINALIHPVKTEPAVIFWKGFAPGFEHADRNDLLAQYPAAQSAMALNE